MEVIGLMATLSLIESPSEQLLGLLGVLDRPGAAEGEEQSLLQVQVRRLKK